MSTGRRTHRLRRLASPSRRSIRSCQHKPGCRAETSCLTLVWAVLDLYISHATNGINFTQLERQHLKRISYEDHDEAAPEEVTAA